MNASLFSRRADKPRPDHPSEAFQNSNSITPESFLYGVTGSPTNRPAWAGTTNEILTSEERGGPQSELVSVMNQATLYLQDGSSMLDVWPRNFHRLPSIEDLIPIDSPDCGILRDYKPHARITRIEPDPGNRSRIYLEAEVRSKSASRTVVFLNENKVPRYWRRTVEAHLRKHLELPIFGWTRSHQPHPVIRVLATPAFTHYQLHKLRSEVSAIMEATEAALTR